ncbi:hypothetical protein [Mesorhizobium sp. WSM4906]|uniref:hypothetical protein n=1 Tax=unclassified Mesorhizobium TaxID=325217 RepID=UPI00325ABAF5
MTRSPTPIVLEEDIPSPITADRLFLQTRRGHKKMVPDNLRETNLLPEKKLGGGQTSLCWLADDVLATMEPSSSSTGSSWRMKPCRMMRRMERDHFDRSGDGTLPTLQSAFSRCISFRSILRFVIQELDPAVGFSGHSFTLLMWRHRIPGAD